MIRYEIGDQILPEIHKDQWSLCISDITIIRFSTAIIGAIWTISEDHNLELFQFDQHWMVQGSQIWLHLLLCPQKSIKRHQDRGPKLNKNENITIIRFSMAIIEANLAIGNAHNHGFFSTLTIIGWSRTIK